MSRRRALWGLLLGLLLLSPAAPADGARADTGQPAEAKEEPRKSPLGLVAIDEERPIAIRSAELEAVTTEGARELRFTGDVEVEQDDLLMTTDSLEALYPEGENQPDRLVAVGNVVLIQRKAGKSDLEARCDRAVYDRPARTLSCRGHARLRDGDNEVRGERIDFDLATETVRVSGGASVVIQPAQKRPRPAPAKRADAP